MYYWWESKNPLLPWKMGWQSLKRLRTDVTYMTSGFWHISKNNEDIFSHEYIHAKVHDNITQNGTSWK